MESPIVSSTKLLAMIYIAYRSYYTIRPSKSEISERERREKDKRQFRERASTFIVEIFPFFLRHLCNSCIMLNFIGLAISQLNPELFHSNEQVNVDTDVPRNDPFSYVALISIPYASSFFKWNGLADVINVLLCVIGFEFREWSMRVLGRFFTLKLGISEGHYIVDTGPYRFLRHPSYTGILLATFPLVHLTVAPTLHEAILPFITKVLGIVALNFGTGSYVSQAILGLVGVLEDSLVSNFIGLLISSSILAFHTYNLCILRIPQEETMLKKTFGENWDKFAATRARIVPFIY